jgi:sarcosine oxidase/L-pipecolate oxidase
VRVYREIVCEEELSNRSGVTCLASADDTYGHKFVTSAYKNLKANNIAATLTPTPESIKALAPNNIKIGPLKGREGYANPVGGWAEAARATKVGLGMVVKEGGVVRGGCEVVGLEKEGKTAQGVVLKDGEVVRGDIVLVSLVIDLGAVADGRSLLELGMSSMTRVAY